VGARGTDRYTGTTVHTSVGRAGVVFGAEQHVANLARQRRSGALRVSTGTDAEELAQVAVGVPEVLQHRGMSFSPLHARRSGALFHRRIERQVRDVCLTYFLAVAAPHAEIEQQLLGVAERRFRPHAFANMSQQLRQPDTRVVEDGTDAVAFAAVDAAA